MMSLQWQRTYETLTEFLEDEDASFLSEALPDVFQSNEELFAENDT